MNAKLSRGLWGLGAFLSVGVALFSYRYLGPPNVTESPQILANLFARPFLTVHVAGAATALLVCGFQFLPALRRRRAIHRWLGRAYVTACMVGGVGGLVMAFGTTSGPVAAWGFGLLAPTWILVTAQGWLAARARRFDEHRAWMIRSFALTFAAVTLRLYLGALQASGLSFEEAYPITAWISWVPNLIVAELYLRRGMSRRLQAAE
ncbi:DUF2306 domain-containing protein [Phenylobacterium sp.]|uniref:DUF2306 domain-containing protein n=1 Tax=Phenylobacterium sp. TaxID=1871053 RepID=UPI0025F9168F|nr:DUF2306 domain-containing protein [Phenylobacterium sp.]